MTACEWLMALGRAAAVVALSEYEAHPVAVMEALTLGIPTVGLDTTGIGDLVEDGLVRGVPRNASPTTIARALVAALGCQRVNGSARLPTWDTATLSLAHLYRIMVATVPQSSHSQGPSACWRHSSFAGSWALVHPNSGDGSRRSLPLQDARVSDPLSRGGLALIANTGLTGILGFGYWIIATHLFSTYAVGVAGALVAATTLFSGIGQLNLSGMLIRFLPRAEGKSRRLVLTTYTFAGTTSALLAIAALTLIDFFSSRLPVAPEPNPVSFFCTGSSGYSNFYY